MKKWTLVFVCLLFFLLHIPHLTAKAANVTLEMETDETVGIIEDYDGDYLFIMGEALTYGGLDDLVIQVGDTPIYNLLTGLPVYAGSIKIGMEVRIAYHIQANSYPQAVAIWLYPGHEDAAVFSTIVSDNIYYGFDYTVFLSADGRYRINLTADTYIYFPCLGIAAPEDIVPGQELFVWVDTITASSPALVFPKKVVSICPFR
ncbi:MAG: hypothetical protein FWC92_06235 [Defluviitaleaceae bacterium]|nr:hypothetical protein [Defluviitaleaceae bacterium]